MVNEALGLQTSPATWMLAGGLLALWVVSLPMLVSLRGGWTRVLMSLTGLSWLAFGLGILFRFFLLSYDAVTFGDLSNRLIDRPAAVVNLALVNAGVYWLTFTAAALALRIMPPPRLLATLFARADEIASSPLLPSALLFCCVCMVASAYGSTPGVLVTPLALLGSMWVVPATIAWVQSFGGTPTSRLKLALVLAPGVLRVVLTPYREHILLILFVPLVAAAVSRRQLRLQVVAPAAVALALLSTVVIGAYRDILWAGLSTDRVVSRVSFEYWDRAPYEAPWTENLRRFHVFDSLMLTVDLVPDVFPFSTRNLIVEGVTRGLVPRLLDPSKAASDEGERFQTTIWMFDTDPNSDEATAAIAPSMPGSLFEAGGTLYVALGACLWAALLAAIDRLKSQLSVALAAGLHVLCSVQALAGLERDYALAFSTLLQTLVVFTVCAIAAAWTMAAGEARQAQPLARI